jgi:hypothetical protein
VLAEFALGVVLFAAFAQSVQRITWIAGRVPMEFLLASLIAAAGALYVLRRRARFAFATLELLAGIAILALAAHGAGKLASPSSADARGLWLLETLAGLYLAVDGLDNVVTAG